MIGRMIGEMMMMVMRMLRLRSGLILLCIPLIPLGFELRLMAMVMLHLYTSGYVSVILVLC